MSRIGATLKAGNHVILRGQDIDHLSFTFIAPLQTQQDVNLTFVHLSLAVFVVVFFFFEAFFIRVSFD